MKTTRKRCSSNFKAKVALEAIRGDLMLAELGAKHGIRSIALSIVRPSKIFIRKHGSSFRIALSFCAAAISWGVKSTSFG